VLGVEELVQRLVNNRVCTHTLKFSTSRQSRWQVAYSPEFGGGIPCENLCVCLRVPSPGEECPCQRVLLLPVSWLTPSPAGAGRAGGCL